MVVVATRMDFEYDVRALLMTFLPLEEVEYRMVGADEREDWRKGRLATMGTGKALILPDFTHGVWDAAYYEGGVRKAEGEAMAPTCVEAADEWKRDGKNIVKRLVFCVLKKGLGVAPPWGTLTGVRPTKLPMGRFMEGYDEEETSRWMKESFYCREDKIALSVGVAKKEWAMVRNLDVDGGFSLYVGIPFCPTRCRYCSFPAVSMETHAGLVEGYLKALGKEMERVGGGVANRSPTTVYIGGGTPTALSAMQLEWLIEKIRDCFDFRNVAEFTVEAGRPDGLTKDKLKVMYDQGVGRISINPQTMKQKTLGLIGRLHSVEEVVQSFYLAREVGFDNINVDLIAGLPEETPSDFRDTLSGIRPLRPDCLTIHSLVVKRASELRLQKEYDDQADGRRREEEDGVDEMLEMGRSFAKEEGYEPYYMYRQKHKASLTNAAFRENVGYAKRGKECLYNVLMMEERQTILGVGAGAVSKYVRTGVKRMERSENVKNVGQYIERIDEMIGRHRGLV